METTLSHFMEVMHDTVFPSFPNQHPTVLRIAARAPTATHAHQTPAAQSGDDRLVRHHCRSGRLGRDRAVCSRSSGMAVGLFGPVRGNPLARHLRTRVRDIGPGGLPEMPPDLDATPAR